MNPEFKKLTVSGWRQFHNISIEFHPTLTVITGANGAGKSSLLGILTQHFGWQRYYLGTPLKKRANGSARFLSGVRVKRGLPPQQHEVGSIEYTTIAGASIQTGSEGIQNTLQIYNQQPVVGTFISSHRPPPTFHQITTIGIHAISSDNAYGQYHSESVMRAQGQYHGQGPIFRLKETLVSMAHFGAKTEYSAGDQDAIETLTGFSRILKKTLPPSLGFRDISIRLTDIVLETETGNFLLDAASGGIIAIIDISWQIYIFSRTTQARQNGRLCVVMDEPENHLHPSMQRSLLSSLISAFPQVQFIVATHSPFIVSSVQDSAVYVLRYTEIENSDDVELDDGTPFSRLVYSERLDVVNRAGSASDILRDVLGVPVTVPTWVEHKLDLIVEDFRSKELTIDNLSKLRTEMAKLGFGELYPQALAKLVESHD